MSTSQKTKPTIKFILTVAFGLFVLVNAAYSQVFPSLYYMGLKNENNTAVLYLKSIQSRPEFTPELLRLMNTYGPPIKEGVYYDESVRTNYIKSLEELSAANPASPDLYYQLSNLYKAQGDETRSNEFLQKARMLDPSL